MGTAPQAYAEATDAPTDSRAVGGMSAMSGVNTTVPGLLAGPSVTVALTQRPVASLTA